jgi:4-amino-4-deoxy-L-arabinose transferase-like glycosyltransferase
MEHIALFTKGLLAIVLLGVCFSSIYIYRVWSKDTSRRVKIGIMGFTIELGPALGDSAPRTEVIPETKH